jgi:hypothetical protein
VVRPGEVTASWLMLFPCLSAFYLWLGSPLRSWLLPLQRITLKEFPPGALRQSQNFQLSELLRHEIFNVGERVPLINRIICVPIYIEARSTPTQQQ